MKYQVIKKSNGKYAPRIVGRFGSVWFKEPYEYPTFSMAADAVLSVKREHEAGVAAQKVDVTYTLCDIKGNENGELWVVELSK